MHISDNLSEIKKYRPAKLRIGKAWYVEYYAYNPELKKMCRKKVMLNYIENLSERRIYGSGLVKRLNAELKKGWNPFINEDSSNNYILISKLLDDFIKLNRKKYADGDIRESTIRSYNSYYNKLNVYLVKQKSTEMYVTDYNKKFIISYLDYVYNDLNLSSRTRDNHLKFQRLFCNYLVERSYMNISPAASISVLGKGKRTAKNRTVIPLEIMTKVSEYLNKNNRNFLIAAQILYFCMVRPKEMTFIKIEHINVDKSTIFISGTTAKNYMDAVVTIPETLKSLLLEMKINEYPKNYYLFSGEFKPGKIHIRETLFSKYWDRYVRKALNLPLSLKFYSLKDTGITDMIRAYNDPLIARDQARHHDLSITNLYTPTDMKQANEKIKHDTRKF